MNELLSATIASLVLILSVSVGAQELDLKRNGALRVDPLFAAQDPSRTSGGSVTFEPGARSAWHTHPRGQILVVTAGSGWGSAGKVGARR